MKPNELPEFFFNIDVIGVCNPKCPSCPSGNYQERINPTEIMNPGLLEAILDKAMGECRVSGVGLYIWNEPLLHPQIADLVRIVESRGIPCHLSSNLNKVRDLENLMRSNPRTFRISMSGFHQKTYERTHRGGNVEVVKENMIALAKAKKATAATTAIHVLFHRYKTNLGDERELRRFTERLGFVFKTNWAYFFPLEKIMAHVDPSFTDVQCTSEDEALIDSLLLPLEGALAASRAAQVRNCYVRDQQMTIDAQGRVQLCCGVFDSRKYSLGSFLDSSLSQLQEKKCQHQMCGKCMRHGLHVYGTSNSKELVELAVGTAEPKYRDMLMAGFRKKRLHERLHHSLSKRWYRLIGNGIS